MSGAPFSDEQRLAFGRVAEQYERARPSYPDAAIEEALSYAGVEAGELVVEVGAGTGKATRLITTRGRRVLALEPDPAMAAICRAVVDPPPVEVLETDFESWRPDPEARVGLVFCAQAWHWLDPTVRWQRASEVLREGGAVAVLWTFPLWQRIPLRAALDEVYARSVPEMAAGFPLHPGTRAARVAEVWPHDIGDGFGDVNTSEHDWPQRYSSEQYVDLIATHQDHIRLDAGRKEELLAGVAAAIDRHGDGIEIVYRTTVCLARWEGR